MKKRNYYIYIPAEEEKKYVNEKIRRIYRKKIVIRA